MVDSLLGRDELIVRARLTGEVKLRKDEGQAKEKKAVLHHLQVFSLRRWDPAL